jgi:hypothetical protein
VSGQAPARINRIVRKAVGDDRGLVANTSADRAAYLDRIDKQAVGHEVQRS